MANGYHIGQLSLDQCCPVSWEECDPVRTLNLVQWDLCQTSDLWSQKIANLWHFKPLSVWQFVMAASSNGIIKGIFEQTLFKAKSHHLKKSCSLFCFVFILKAYSCSDHLIYGYYTKFGENTGHYKKEESRCPCLTFQRQILTQFGYIPFWFFRHMLMVEIIISSELLND